MQYLLTEEEYMKLVTRGEVIREEAKETIMDLCQRVADNEPVKRSWQKDKKLEPWKCLRTTKISYCDECPVQEVCTFEHKKWSK